MHINEREKLGFGGLTEPVYSGSVSVWLLSFEGGSLLRMLRYLIEEFLPGDVE